MAERAAPKLGCFGDPDRSRDRRFEHLEGVGLCGLGGRTTHDAAHGHPLRSPYGYDAQAGEAAPERAQQILRLLSGQLEAQKARGSAFFIGDQLSALDIYWAAFAAMLRPLPDELCPMNEMMRQNYTATDPALLDAASPLLLEHRQRIYEAHMELPIEL